MKDEFLLSQVVPGRQVVIFIIQPSYFNRYLPTLVGELDSAPTVL